MPLTNQPYLPLYVDDWMNNNKLKLCSPGAHGLMISIMCLMHKEEEYGKILLKQKFKQTDKQILNFASQIAKQTCFDLLDVEMYLTELITEKVLFFEEDYLICNRMVNDAEISEKRSNAGKQGGKQTQLKTKNLNKNFAKAKHKANTVIGIDIENVIVNDNNIREKTKKTNLQVIMPFQSKEFFELWDQWKTFRIKEFKKTYKSAQSEQAALTELVQISQGQEDIAKESILKSISRQWMGFYAPKNQNENGNQTSTYTKKPTGGNVSTSSAFDRIDKMFNHV